MMKYPGCKIVMSESAKNNVDTSVAFLLMPKTCPHFILHYSEKSSLGEHGLTRLQGSSPRWRSQPTRPLRTGQFPAPISSKQLLRGTTACRLLGPRGRSRSHAGAWSRIWHVIPSAAATLVPSWRKVSTWRPWPVEQPSSSAGHGRPSRPRTPESAPWPSGARARSQGCKRRTWRRPTKAGDYARSRDQGPGPGPDCSPTNQCAQPPHRVQAISRGSQGCSLDFEHQWIYPRNHEPVQGRSSHAAE